MRPTIFFSWQADTPTGVGLEFVESALKDAVQKAGITLEVEEADREEEKFDKEANDKAETEEDDDEEFEFEIDRDTKGVAGSPPIVDTIFGKIDDAAIFVSDMTFVGSRLDGRPTPNPNVCIEHGWALKKLTYRRVISVMNTAYGHPTETSLPFDIRHMRRPITYHLPQDAGETERKKEHKKLTKIFRKAIAAIVNSETYKKEAAPPQVLDGFTRAASSDGPAYFRNLSAPIGKRSAFNEMIAPGAPITVQMYKGPGIWLRMKPVKLPEKEFSLGETTRVIEANPGSAINSQALSGGLSYVFGSDGTGIFYSARQPGFADILPYVFKTGEIWGVDTISLTDYTGPGIPGWLEGTMRKTFSHYTKIMNELGFDYPYQWKAGFEGIRDQKICVPQNRSFRQFNPPTGPCLEDRVEANGIYRKGDSEELALIPLFQKLYEAFAINRPNWLDEV